MQKLDLEKVHYMHIFGIGGIGVSGLARMMQHEGHPSTSSGRVAVSGQDTTESPVTEALAAAGIAVSIGQDITRIPRGTDLIVYSLAVAEREPEFLEKVRALGIPMFSYPEVLGLVSQGKYTIAVAGTHGKTTTTAMIAEVLVEAGFDPTVIVGSLLKRNQSNFIAGKSRPARPDDLGRSGGYFVVEADEYQRSFLYLLPTILVITNIGHDHLDYYKDFSDIQSAFAELVAKVPADGFVIANAKDLALTPVLAKIRARMLNWADFFDEKLVLPIAGVHNRENAACALAVAHALGVDPRVAREALTAYAGTWRRFDYRGKTPGGALVYDDYAHNPDKVRAAIAGYREAFPKHRLTVVFQPHLYSRTKMLLDGFARAFDGADEVIITPIFAAREHSDGSISSDILAERIKKHADSKSKSTHTRAVSSPSDLGELATDLRDRLTKRNVLITMGAGDIYELADLLVA